MRSEPTMGETKRRHDGRSDLAALRHPLFWIALAALVLNDHVLKGAGLLPGSLTGKLSDFAGLIVVPVLLSALLGSRTPRRRALAFAAVGGWFAAANLVPAVARATESVGALIGMSWTFVVDPTDLVALAVLPLAWHVAAHRGPPAPRRAAERLALGLGVAASVASPQPDPRWQTDAFLVNRTGREVEVRVRWVDVSMECAEVRDRPADVLARDAFAAGTTFLVGIDETLPLNRNLRAGGAGRGDGPVDRFADAGVSGPFRPSHEGDCDAAILTVDGLMLDQLVYWEDVSDTLIPVLVEDAEDERAVAGGLDLIATDEAGTELGLVGGARYTLEAPTETYDGGAGCRDYGTVTGFAWSDLPQWTGEQVRLLEVRPTVDGCVSVTIEQIIEPLRAFICVPPEDFPFLSNNQVQIWVSEQELRIVRDLRLDDGTTWRTGELRVLRGVGRVDEGPFELDLVTVDAECGGLRMDCGGFRVPAAGGLRFPDGMRFVHPGDLVERTTVSGRRARLRVGRAEHMVATHPACGAGRDVLGPRLDALVSYGEEPR